VIDSNVTDGSELLDDAGVTVLDAYLHDLDIALTRDGITVCAAVSGAEVCD
jgi:metal-dependent HD superfamily phosphatase/phosphodiesterase